MKVTNYEIIQAIHKASDIIKTFQGTKTYLPVIRFLYVDTINELKEKVLRTFEDAGKAHNTNFLNQPIDLESHKNMLVFFSTARDLTKDLYQRITAEMDQEAVQGIHDRQTGYFPGKPSIYSEKYNGHVEKTIKDYVEKAKKTQPITFGDYINKVFRSGGADLVEKDNADFVKVLLDIKKIKTNNEQLTTQELIECLIEVIPEFGNKAIKFDQLFNNREENLKSIGDIITGEEINKIKAIYTANFNALINKNLTNINKVTSETIEKITTDIGKKQNLEYPELYYTEELAQFYQITGDSDNHNSHCEII